MPLKSVVGSEWCDISSISLSVICELQTFIFMSSDNATNFVSNLVSTYLNVSKLNML